MNCVLKAYDCPVCKSSITTRYHYLVLLKIQAKCENTKIPRYKQSCLERLFKQTIATIELYPDIGQLSEEIIKYCVSSIDIPTIQIVLSNYDILSSEIIDLIIQKYGIKKSYSDYLILLIKKCFGLNMKSPLSDIDRVASFVEKYGNVSDYTKYNIQAIDSALEWKSPNLTAVTFFITRLGNQLPDHELFCKRAVEASIKGSNMDAFNQLINHFGLQKDRVWTRSLILDTITYSFQIRNFQWIEPIIKNHGKQDELLDYLKLIVENMVKSSNTTQTIELFDKFAKESDGPILVSHAIRISTQESKFDVVNFIIKKYGNPESFKLYVVGDSCVCILLPIRYH